MSKPRLSLQQNKTQNNTAATKINMNINTDQPPQLAVDWESERQLVSSLAKLQELESKIHTLRTLLPNRLLAPINPIINDHQQRSNGSNNNNALPRNPQDLNARLTKAAISGVAEVAELRALWQSPETYAIWARLTQKMKEGNGAFPQPSGMWERDYAELLKELEAEDKSLRKDGDDDDDNNNNKGEGLERGQQSDITGWKAIVESFQQRQLPHFRIATSKTSSSVLLVHLGLAGIAFELEQAAATSSSDSSTAEWRVSTHSSSSSRPVSRLETAIVQQLNARQRKWDLRYLLVCPLFYILRAGKKLTSQEMILAYSDIRRSPCKKCNMMTDSQAQLPIVRRAVDSDAVDNKNNMNEGKVETMAIFKTAISLAGLSAIAAALPATPASQGFSLNQVAVPKTVARHPAAHLAKAYSKYGAAVPNHVAAAAAATGSVVTTPGEDEALYITKITVGSDTLNIDIDTGSADLWAFSSLTPASERKGHNYYTPGDNAEKVSGASWDISYGDGSSASGDVYKDTVKVGGVSFDKQAIEVATKASSSFTDDTAIDGLLGLAFSSINTVSPSPEKTFFDNIKDSLSKPIFGVLLKHGAPGVYDFGFADDSKYTGDIAYTDVDDSEGFWSFTADGYSIGSSSEEAVFASESLTGIADTGTTLLLLDDTVVDAYYKKVDGAKYDSTQGGYVFPSSTTPPDLSFKIGDYTATIPGEYIGFAAVDSSNTYGGLQSNSGIGLSIFGDIFLKSQYVVFDSEGPQIGFAAQK
ncbi:uncharacterized protein TRUGW13939_01680 [Talaromyces rugulosus]|uniref:Peptidase A1 domain-containing protein n=1 Tax=Talaromyces rugulosus TaxID=121627 RepID=A0A7H8QLE5_TALRU|nr:uncharacterized protein TRUGW13939_01680 [Talaromyces rugulosus]QKX54592.1 hypothetical protein TRUGW13939_01680 [Talaromyces rugulosus]